MFAALVLAALAADAPAAPSTAAAPALPVVLVTAYGPFAGRGVNGSETIARSLDGAVIAGAVVRIRVLPVRWGEPARVLPTAVAETRPVLLLGLGEGHPGRVAVEQVGRNRCQAIPDEERRLPPTSLLEAGGPAERAATLRFDAGWFADPPVPVAASRDAGGYLCNALLYQAAALPVARVGFVHLPPQGDESADAYRARLRPLIVTLIERNR